MQDESNGSTLSLDVFNDNSKSGNCVKNNYHRFRKYILLVIEKWLPCLKKAFVRTKIASQLISFWLGNCQWLIIFRTKTMQVAIKLDRLTVLDLVGFWMII